jgi:uncharacterized protein YndB with AHSA1/START domain
MSDIIDQVNAVARSVGRRTIPAGDGRTVVLSRTYDAPIDEVWDAVSTGERVNRWLGPVDGDLRLGGRYQIEGNAQGEILECEPPRRLKVSWAYGESPSAQDMSEVELRLEPDGDGTRLVLEHAAVVPDEMWEQYGPGAVGVGWDLGLLGLDRHLRGEDFDPASWESEPDAKRAAVHAAQAWGAATAEAGESDEVVARQVAGSQAFFTA